MKQAEAKPQIISLWKDWLRANASGSTGQDMQLFYNFLREQAPDLLTFKASGDKWQVVKGWIQVIG